MTPEQAISAARERVLEAAARLFNKCGYLSVTMRDIAEALGIRQPSLYYHAPKGKEQLFVEVVERNLERYGEGLERAIGQAEPDLEAQFRAIAQWLLSQPPLDLTRLFRSDLPAISEESAQKLTHVAIETVFMPIKQAIITAYEQEKIRQVDPAWMAVSFLTLVEAMHDMHRYTNTPKATLVDEAIVVLFDGLRQR